MPQKQKTAAMPAPMRAAAPILSPESELDIAIACERLAIAVMVTMTGGYRNCPERACRQRARCMSSAATDICRLPRPEWADDIALGARHFLRRFVEEGR